MMVTWSLLLPHAPLLTDHWNVCTPTVSPLICVAGEAALLKVPDPVTTVHVPTAGAAAALAFMVTLVTGVQIFWSGPAFATGS